MKVVFKMVDSIWKITKTIWEWEEELGFDVLDPDGFDRKDKDLYSRLFTKEEFLQKCGLSTLSDVGLYVKCLKEAKIVPDCSCKKSDAWRCAKGTKELSCQCVCHI